MTFKGQKGKTMKKHLATVERCHGMTFPCLRCSSYSSLTREEYGLLYTPL